MTEFPMNSHSGYLAVRIPEFNYDEEGRGVYLKKPPKLGSVYYGGVFRMPWFDVEEDFFLGVLPKELVDLWKRLKKENNDFSGLHLCQNYSNATKMLAYSNRESVRNELIAVRSKVLSEIKNETTFSEVEVNIDWLGYDIVAIGHWSLLEGGLFAAPSYFSHWTNRLNSHGLFSEDSFLEEYSNDYQRAALRNGVEALPSTVYGIDSIQIGKVSDKA